MTEACKCPQIIILLENLKYFENLKILNISQIVQETAIWYAYGGRWRKEQMEAKRWRQTTTQTKAKESSQKRDEHNM